MFMSPFLPRSAIMAIPIDVANLHYAAETNDLQLAERILRRHPRYVNYPLSGWAALHTASHLGHEKLVSLLLEMGAAVNLPTQPEYESPLMVAVRGGHNSVIARLLEWGADLNQYCSDRWMRETPLHVAASLKQTGPLHLLLLRGAVDGRRNLRGEKALDVARRCRRKPNEIILMEFARDGFRLGIRSRILESHARGFIDRSGKIHLRAGILWAVKKGHVEIAEYLLDIDKHLVDVCDDANYRSLLHYATCNCDDTMVNMLLHRGARVNSPTAIRGWSPLHFAAQRGYSSIVKQLLSRGGDIFAQTHRGMTPRILAARSNHEHVVRIIDGYARKDPTSHSNVLVHKRSGRARKKKRQNRISVTVGL